MSIGARDKLIVIERQGEAVDNGFTRKAPDDWPEFTRAYAEVLYGTGQERREAAQEGASQAATFICGWTPKLAQVTVRDRLHALARDWDVTSVIIVGRNREVHLTALAAV